MQGHSDLRTLSPSTGGLQMKRTFLVYKNEMTRGVQVTREMTTHLTIYGCSNVSTTLVESCVKFWRIKLRQHIPGKFQECCHNVAAKRCKKTSQHYGNIN